MDKAFAKIHKGLGKLDNYSESLRANIYKILVRSLTGFAAVTPTPLLDPSCPAVFCPQAIALPEMEMAMPCEHPPLTDCHVPDIRSGYALASFVSVVDDPWSPVWPNSPQKLDPMENSSDCPVDIMPSKRGTQLADTSASPDHAEHPPALLDWFNIGMVQIDRGFSLGTPPRMSDACVCIASTDPVD